MDFLNHYYINPILEGTGYNPVNTLTYGILLVISIYILYKLLEKLEIKINRNFFLSIFPFIALGGLLRALEDLFEVSGMWKDLLGYPFIVKSSEGVVKNILLITPFIYLLVFGFALISLLVSIWLSRKTEIEYYKILSLIGIASIVIFLPFLRIRFPLGLLEIFILTGSIFGIFYLFHKLGVISLNNSIVVSSHGFDASSTFISLSTFPYFEQHFLPSFLISRFGAWVMFPLKILVVLIILIWIDREVKEENFANWLKLVIFTLGFAPGLRDALRLIMLV